MASIRSYVEPLRLYRYRSLKHFDREMGAIQNAYLFCSPYLELNDPMEGLFSSSRLVRESEDHSQIRRAIRENKEQIGICSFSEVHDHELMWAHYADQFRGICIAYSLSKLLGNLRGEVSFVRMYYSEKVPTVRRTDEEASQQAKMILSYKSYRWLYEREWRMFAPLGKACYHDIACVARVYLGFRITDRNRDRIMNRLSGLGIETQDMTIDKYSISFEPGPES